MLNKLAGITIQETKSSIKPFEDYDLDFYVFWDKLKTAQFKAIFLISLKNWRNGVDFLLKMYPLIKANKDRIKHGQQIIEIYENCETINIVNLLAHYVYRENQECVYTILDLLKPKGITKKDINLL